jgi:hypothetical protein
MSRLTIMFALGRSRAVEGEPDGFTTLPSSRLPEKEARWLDVEEQRATVFHDMLRSTLSEATGSDPSHLRLDYTLSHNRERLRPTIIVEVTQPAKLPEKTVLNYVSSTSGLLGGRDWVSWDSAVVNSNGQSSPGYAVTP